MPDITRGQRGKTSHRAGVGGRFAAHGLRPPLAEAREIEREMKSADRARRLSENNAMQAVARPNEAPEDGTIRKCPHCWRDFPNGPLFHAHVSGCANAFNDGAKPENNPGSVPQICWVCGLMCLSKGARRRHQSGCCREGAD